jgi:phage-related minor tail protein
MTQETLSEKLVVQIAADTAPLTQGLAQAGRDLSQFTGGAVAQASRAMTSSFATAFGALAKNASSAAKSGESAIDKMVDSILRALERIAIRKFIVNPLAKFLENVATAAVGSLTGRATGGAVGAGNAYLVGEHGPEVFVPSVGGEITGMRSRARPSVVVNIHARDAQSVLKSESQIAAMMSRALAKGQRNL